MTVDEAEMTLQMLGVEIDRIFNERKAKTKVAEMEIRVEKGQDKIKELIDLVKDLTVTEASGLLYGLDDQLKISLRKENKDRKLETIKIELL